MMKRDSRNLGIEIIIILVAFIFSILILSRFFVVDPAVGGHCPLPYYFEMKPKPVFPVIFVMPGSS